MVQPLLRLSTYATAMGMALVILSITSGKGLQQAINDQFRTLEGDITINEYSVRRTGESSAILLSDSLLQTFRNSTDIKEFRPEIRKAALLVHRENDAFEGIEIIGYEPEQLAQFRKDYTGHQLNFKSRYGIYVSNALLGSLGLEVGDTAVLVSIQGQRQTPRLRDALILGDFETGLEEFNKNHIVMDLQDVRRMSGWRTDSVTHYSIVLEHPEDRNTVAAYWNALLPYTMQAQGIEAKHPAIFGWLALFDTNILLVLFIVLIVAVANLCIALLVLIVDRTKMIGTLKAMGASDRTILGVFSWLGMRILLTGLLWGNAVGLGLSFLQWQYGLVELDPSTYYISTAPIRFDWLWILGGNLIFILFSFIVVRIPVRWISKLDPIKSLRFS